MILVGYTFGDVLTGILWTSLVLLVVVIAYQRILKFLSSGSVNHEEFMKLYELEYSEVSGEVPFYFTSPVEKEFSILILDKDMKEIKEVIRQKSKVGGNIIRFDTKALPNGSFFYCLKTDNHKVMKKMTVKNN